jgi:hypothetical protein
MLVHENIPVGFEIVPHRPGWPVKFGGYTVSVGREVFDARGERDHVDLVLDEAGDDCNRVEDGVVAVEELEEVVC